MSASGFFVSCEKRQSFQPNRFILILRGAFYSFGALTKEYNAKKLPKTLDKYYDMKYNDPPTHKALKAYTHRVDKGEVSAFLGFDQFEKVAKEPDTLTGLKTVSGIEITGYSDHCVGRVIGQAGLSKEYNRKGVPVEIVRKCLTEGEILKRQVSSDGKNSVTYLFDGKKVSVNPDDGIIIQVNGKGWNRDQMH